MNKKRVKILLVDDRPANLPVSVESGEQAPRAVLRLRHAAGPSLPQRFMDALAAASGETVAVAGIAADVRWPAYRALALAHGDVLPAEDARFDQHLSKPVSVEALERVFRAAAGAPQ